MNNAIIYQHGLFTVYCQSNERTRRTPATKVIPAIIPAHIEVNPEVIPAEAPIERLLNDYRANRSQSAFTELYEMTVDLRDTNSRILIRSGYDSSDALAIFDDTFMRVINKDMPGAFIPYLSVSLKNARINHIRSNTRRISQSESLDCEFGDDGYTVASRIASDTDTESDALAPTLHTDRLALIRSLLKGADELTLAIVEGLPRYESLNALASGLGVHHTAVSRKLRALSRNYDAKLFGSLTDYIAV